MSKTEILTRDNDMTVDVLGMTWCIRFRTPSDDALLCDAAGLCDWTTRTITVKAVNDGNLGLYRAEQDATMRHELIHAFLYECGIGYDYQAAEKYGHDETMVDWVARMWPRIRAVFEEVGVG